MHFKGINRTFILMNGTQQRPATIRRVSTMEENAKVSSRDKNEGTYRSGEGGGGPAM